MKKHTLSAVALTAILAVPLTGCNSGRADLPASDADGTPLPVAVISPHIADIKASYETTGTIEAESEAPITARADGDVVEILVEEGDVVVRGQVLARLDGDRARLRAQRARADFKKSSSDYERLSNLHERGLISKAAYEALEYDVQAGKAAYDLAALDYEYTIVRSTIDGIVTSRNVNIGSNVREGQATFVVTDTDSLVAYLDIPQTELPKFAAGHEAVLTVDSDPDTEFSAFVERISPTIDADRGTFRATLAIDNTAGRIAPGMFGRFTVAYETHTDALVVPVSATVREDSDIVVYVVADGEVSRRKIKTGIVADGMIEIIGGLAADEAIVLSGQMQLRDGSRVLISSAETSTRARG